MSDKAFECYQRYQSQSHPLIVKKCGQTLDINVLPHCWQTVRLWVHLLTGSRLHKHWHWPRKAPQEVLLWVMTLQALPNVPQGFHPFENLQFTWCKDRHTTEKDFLDHTLAKCEPCSAFSRFVCFFLVLYPQCEFSANTIGTTGKAATISFWGLCAKRAVHWASLCIGTEANSRTSL